ncbi:signal recognition particle protein Srp19 [Candidatus Methanocrinis natronophilus]|uniref:Signal recognition particle 19 kDa protein n=1 Tax=Candidatus Methanocrinis natronophilus TaxID=3033396 RepID=A0ABT5X812_9EURY|nr:signal recognition particle protein Srp19 [Candidatus Methanocrinis natronophilus]MDF0590840.1 signal recognition particle protein Srp19 [Candidatus Methanocrinis natronophilus]
MSKKDGRLVIWPAYIDAGRSRGEGRQVSRRDALEKPTIDEMMAAAMEMGLQAEAERDKRYPKEWWEKSGRVLLQKKGPKTALVKEIARRAKKRRG